MTKYKQKIDRQEKMLRGIKLLLESNARLNPPASIKQEITDWYKVRMLAGEWGLLEALMKTEKLKHFRFNGEKIELELR